MVLIKNVNMDKSPIPSSQKRLIRNRKSIEKMREYESSMMSKQISSSQPVFRTNQMSAAKTAQRLSSQSILDAVRAGNVALKKVLFT